MKKDECEVMDRFLAGEYLEGEYTYDVKLYKKKFVPLHGFGYNPLNMFFGAAKGDIQERIKKLDSMLRDEAELFAKRIDAVVETPTEIWLLEVTPKLKKHVIGGVLFYRDLFMYQFEPTKLVRLGIVAGVDDPMAHYTLRKHDIKLWVV